MPNVFEILEIEPTSDFKTVKKAYAKKALQLHPDKFSTAEESILRKKNVQFQELANAYEQVNDPKKLEDYFNEFLKGKIDTDDSSIPKQDFNNSNDSTEFGNEPSDGLWVPKRGFVDIFVPIEVSDVTKSQGAENDPDSYPLKWSRNIDPQTFADEFNFDLLAKILSKYSKKYIQQVGVTYEEAVDIINQHSSRSYIVIVQVNVSLGRLTERMSESDRSPFGFGNSTAYLWLLSQSIIHSEDIISAKIMSQDEYKNSKKWGFLQPVKTFWPQDVTVVNPDAKSLLTPASHSSNNLLLPSPLSSTQNELKVTQTAPQLFFSRTKFLTLAQKDAINKVIDTLYSEINSCWPYPDKDIKQEKVNALEQLLEYGKTMSVVAAVSKIEAEFERVRHGRISNRTVVLLDNLKQLPTTSDESSLANNSF